MTIDFICEELAELFDSPCNYSPMDEKMFQDSYCESHCGKITDKECWKRYFEKVWADRKTEPQTIRCPKCGRTDYIRDMEKDMGIKGSHYKYKCINCNTYIKHKPTISKMEQVDKDINVRSKTEPQTERSSDADR